MISIKEFRVLILEEDGGFQKYQKKVGYMHQACLDDYAAKNHLLNGSIDNIIKQKKCVIIRNIDDTTLLCDMPETLSDEQLYPLDLLATFCLDDVSYMEVLKHSKNREEFILDQHVGERFSKEVIQSYYQKDINRKRR